MPIGTSLTENLKTFKRLNGVLSIYVQPVRSRHINKLNRDVIFDLLRSEQINHPLCIYYDINAEAFDTGRKHLFETLKWNHSPLGLQ